MLLNLLIPFVLTVGSGSKGLINLTKGHVSLFHCLTCQVLFLLLFPIKAITEVDLNDLITRVILRKEIFFLHFQFGYPGSRLSLLHFLEDQLYLKSFQHRENQETIVVRLRKRY